MTVDFNKRTLLELFPNNTTQLTEAYLTDVNYVTEKITEERTRAEAAEAQLQDNIDAEEARAEAAEETLQANIDAEEARATNAEQGLVTALATETARAVEAEENLHEEIVAETTRAQLAESLKEDKGNKVSSTATYVSNDTKYPTTAAVDARIAEISPKEVFIAVYGTTTATEIQAAINANKAIILKADFGTSVYWGLYSNTTSSEHRFTCVEAPGNYIDTFSCKKDTSVWSFQTSQLELKTNKLADTDTWVSDNTMYPSTKAVDARIAEVAPKGVEWATIGTTTYSQIKSWNDAGKLVLCKNTISGPVDQIMKLTICTPGGAFFCGVQGTSLYTAEVNPANQWQTNTSSLQGFAMHRSYETWDDTNDNKYPSLKAVSEYVAGSGGGIEWAIQDETSFETIKGWHDAGKLVVLKNNSDYFAYLDTISNSSATFTAIDDYYGFFGATVDSDDNWNTWWDEMQTTGSMLPSTSTWSSDDIKYPTTAAVDARIAAISPKEIEWATYGSTTLTKLNEWKTAKKLVLVENSNRIFRMVQCNETAAWFDFIIPSTYSGQNVSAVSLNSIMVNSSSSWTMMNVVSPELQSNKLASTSSWTSNDTKYPTTAAVDARIDAKVPGSEIKWATYGTTSSTDLTSWWNAGHLILMKYNGNVYMMNYKMTGSSRYRFVLLSSNEQYSAGSLPEVTEIWMNGGTWYTNTIKVLNEVLGSTYKFKLKPKVITMVRNSSGYWVTKQAYTFEVPLTYGYSDTRVAPPAGYSREGDAGSWTNGTTSGTESYTAPTASADGKVTITIPSGAYYGVLSKTKQESLYTKIGRGAIWHDVYRFDFVYEETTPDVYEILGGDTIQIPCRKLDYDQSNQDYRAIFGAAGNVYGPRVNVRFTKNGERLTIGSNQWVKINPYSTDGSNTWISGRMINAPTSSWGTTSASAGADMSTLKPFGIGFNLSNSGITNDTVYVRYPADIEITDWALGNSFFVMELYDKNVSQTVPVARKVFQIQPELVEDYYKIQEHMVVEVPVKGKYTSNTGWTRGDNSSGALCSIMPYAINRSGAPVMFSTWHGSDNSDEVTILDSTLISSTDNTTHIKIDAMSSTGTSTHSLSLGFNGTFKFNDGDKTARPALYIKWKRNDVFIGGTYIYIVPVPGNQFTA